MRHAKSLIIGIIGPQHKSEYNIMMPIRYLKKRHAENIKKPWYKIIRAITSAS